jgi:hypothetical protein
MKVSKWYLGLVCIIALGGIPRLSNAFDIRLTQGQIEEAKEYGAKHKGKNIFESPIVKTACFGEYPKGDGGLIMSKYIEIAVISAMQATKDIPITPGELKEIEEGTAIKVVVDVSEPIANPEDIEIILVQESNNILPFKYEFGKEKRIVQDVICFFRYNKLNPTAKTEIIIKTKDRQRKYKINLSAIK